MRETGCLLSPRRRSIARFMNLSAVTVRAANMLRIFPTLNGEDQKTFKFVLTYQQLTEESGCVFQTVNALLKDLKNNGLIYRALLKTIQIKKKYHNILVFK
jgi:hypothetical protein